MVGDLSDPFVLNNNLNPLIIPFRDSFAGNCHDARMLVEVRAITVKPLGAWEGTEINQQQNCQPPSTN